MRRRKKKDTGSTGPGRHPLDDWSDPHLCVSNQFLFLFVSVTDGSKSKCHKSNLSVEGELCFLLPHIGTISREHQDKQQLHSQLTEWELMKITDKRIVR